MNLKALCETYNPKLHYDPEKLLRKVELIIEKEKEKIKDIEKTHANPSFYPKVKDSKGRYIHSQETKDDIKKWEKSLAEHKALVAKYEKYVEKYKKETNAMNENLDEDFKSMANAVKNRITDFARNRTKGIRQRIKDRIARDEANIKEKKAFVENLKAAQLESSKIGGKKWEEDGAALEQAEKKLKKAEKSTLKYGLSHKLPRNLAIILALITMVSSITEPFINPNPLTKEMNKKTIEKELKTLDGVLAEMNPQILSSINSSERIQEKYDEFTKIYNTINFDEKGLPASKADWDKIGKLMPMIRGTINKELSEIDRKAGKAAVTMATRKLINIVRAAGEVFNTIKISVGWGDRYNPRGNN